MRSLRDAIILVVLGIGLSLVPLFTNGKTYIITYHGIATPMHVEWLGWFCLVFGAIMTVVHLSKKK